MLRSVRRGALAGLLCALAAGAVYLSDSSFFGAEWWLFDRYSQQLAKSREPDPRIVLVTVSDASSSALAEFYGRPSAYSREVYARVVDEMQRSGAAVVAFDVLFAEQNETDGGTGDRSFAESLASMPSVLGSQTQEPDPRQPLAPPSATWRTHLWSVRGESGGATYNLVPPHDAFRTTGGIGTMRIARPSRSGTIHEYPLADRLRDAAVPSLAMEAARQFRRSTRTAEWSDRSLLIDGRAIPVSARGDVLLRWNGARRERARVKDNTPDAFSYPNVDLDKVLLASLAREDAGAGVSAEQFAAFEKQFRGKIVLVGFTAAGLLDLRATPLSPRSAGLEIHANALDNLLNHDFNRAAPRALMFPLILLAGIAFGTAIYPLHSQLLSALTAIAAVVGIVLLGYLALGRGWAGPAFTAAVAVVLTYVAITGLKFVAEQRKSAQLRTTFGRYVSPQILDHVLAHPEMVELGGERRELTVLFSDIRGFTTISEASEPEEVVEMLNEYLTRMVDILLAHGGTLDKFIGDAVMGFWNAPAEEPDHPRLAVACAIEMIAETARLRAMWEAEGKPALRIGIGINTGDAVVGNIGSKRVFGYTVIGDTVNLASRLESKNKDYVTEIIVSEFTLAKIGDEFETRYLDEVKVKGKELAVKIYEVRGRKEGAAPDVPAS
ncbi:MAG: adenylate/guanylate cyclase domain-containing protein [Thermoanaerobaculia bacterium]